MSQCKGIRPRDPDPKEHRRQLARLLDLYGPLRLRTLQRRGRPLVAPRKLARLLRHDWFVRDASGRYDVTRFCRVEYLDPLARLGRVRL